MSNDIKFSKTSKIFDDNNFSKLLPVISKTELLKKLNEKGTNDANASNESFLGKRLGKMSRRIYGNSGGQGGRIELQKLSELIQSISIQGLYVNQIIKEIIDIESIGDSVKITYVKPETLDSLYSASNNFFVNGNNSSRVLNSIGIVDSFSINNTSVNYIEEKEKNNNTTIRSGAKNFIDFLSVSDTNGPFGHVLGYPGLSVIQVLDPNLRTCFNQSQEIDAFFNLISTLDITMAMPYVKADFIIPNRLFKQSGALSDTNEQIKKNFITASLNNFLFGSKYASQDANFTEIGKAVNGDYNIDFSKPIQTNDGVKKIYERQHMNSAIFLAPQTMVNADIDDALGNDVGDRKEGALIDKFRPFMTIMDLSFDVRPQKGFLFYKTATLNLMLYDKARMTEIAPFIKPELLNSHSSEITLEYGWQHNLGDDDIVAQNDITNRNPIAQFINSLKVVEKYVIVNSSYTINENGSVNISLSLAMKGPVQLRNTPMPNDTSLDELEKTITTINQYLINDALITKLGTTGENAFAAYSAKRNKMDANNVTLADLIALKEAYEIERDSDKVKYDKSLRQQDFFKEAGQKIDEAIAAINKKKESESDFLASHFDFLKTNDKGDFIHNSDSADKDCNDPFIDKEWWTRNLQKYGEGTEKKSKWISLGKILTSITGKMLCSTNKYNEVQLIFYNLNGKAIRASYLNIASIPVDFEDFRKYLGSIVKDIRKMSVETFLSNVLNRCVNQKAAIVYGLDNFFKFDRENKTQYDIKGESKKSEQQIATAVKEIDASVKGEIIKQYYENLFDEGSNSENGENYLKKSSVDVTFKVPRVVMNFDSMIHETDPQSSILRISFYDELDNPYESLTDIVSSIQSNRVSNVLSSINVYRTSRTSNTQNDTSQASSTKEANEIINELIKNKIILVLDNNDSEITSITNATINSIKEIKLNITGEVDIKYFTNIKQMFKSYMPSLTLGQTNSALLSGNITTNQDAKYATALLMRQDSSVINNQTTSNQTGADENNVKVTADLDASPLFVLPSQASISIVGCPLVNFAQLIFLDFNTNTTIDNIYFVSGIKHNISPGKFSTELTMVQNDLFTRYEAQSTTIKSFLENLKKLQAEEQTPTPAPEETPEVATIKTTSTTIKSSEIKFLLSFFVKFRPEIVDGQTGSPMLFDRNNNYACNGFNLLVNNIIPQIVTEKTEYIADEQLFIYSQVKRNEEDISDIVINLNEYLNDDNIRDQEHINNSVKLLTEFIEMIKIIDSKMHEDGYLSDDKATITKVEIVSGYRSETKNADAGGAKLSRHKTGRAIDFRIYYKGTGTRDSEGEVLDTALLTRIILQECFNLKATGQVMDNTNKITMKDTAKVKSITLDAATQKYNATGSAQVFVGGLGIYPNKPFIHYDIRDDDTPRTDAVVWYDTAGTIGNKHTEENEEETPAVP